MDLCVTDLHKVHQIEPHMPISKVRHIMIDLLNGLKFIHQKNIVHRDIKLSNLLLTADNRVKICDFGVAMILSHRVKMISNREICGTINYLAPEMVGAKSRFELTTAADIWSAGCVMFILLNGLLPFKASKKSYVYTRIRHRIFPVSDHVKQQPGGYAAMSICKDIFNSSHKTRPTASDLLHRRFFSDNNALRTLVSASKLPFFGFDTIFFFAFCFSCRIGSKIRRLIHRFIEWSIGCGSLIAFVRRNAYQNPLIRRN